MNNSKLKHYRSGLINLTKPNTVNEILLDLHNKNIILQLTPAQTDENAELNSALLVRMCNFSQMLSSHNNVLKHR